MASSDWWANKLGGNPSQSGTPPVAPPRPQVYVPQTTQNTRVAYDPQQDQLVTKAQSAREVMRCPGCNSGNYMAPNGTNLKRCYDCGYPLVQAGTGAGMPGGSSGGPTIAAKQPSQGGGFQPNVIVDRIG